MLNVLVNDTKLLQTDPSTRSMLNYTDTSKAGMRSKDTIPSITEWNPHTTTLDGGCTKQP
jgi:hypothetical protein